MCVQVSIVVPRGTSGEAANGSSVQQNRSLGERQRHRQLVRFRTRLFSTGARLWSTGAIARVIGRLRAGGAGGMLFSTGARLWGTSAIVRGSIVMHEIAQGVGVTVFRAALGWLCSSSHKGMSRSTNAAVCNS